MDTLTKLKNNDFYNILLFILFKLNEDEEYSSLSRLAYILDRESLLKLCKFFGGVTVKIPTIEQLQELCEGLLLFQNVDIEKQDFNTVLHSFNKGIKDNHRLVKLYKHIREVLKQYEFSV